MHAISAIYAVTFSVRPRYLDSACEIGIDRGMITLTEKAAAKVRDLQEENGQEGNLLRIFVESGGCSGFQYGMSFDAKKDGDSVLESAGVSFLMDDASLAYMDGSEIDFDDGLQGKGFEIKNPNAESTCGCGKSFS